jgi:hypothetical protein
MQTITNTKLEKDLHIRIDSQLQTLIAKIAAENHLKESTFARIILARHVANYTRNRFFEHSN